MAGAYVQVWTTNDGAIVGSQSLTVSGATSGNLLVAAVGVRGGGDVFTTPTGWTLMEDFSSGSFGGAAYYRIATGDSNDNFNPSWTDTGRAQSMVTEYSGLDGTSPFEDSGEDAAEIADATATSVGSGTATAVNADGMYISICIIQDSSDFATGRTKGAGISNSASLGNFQYYAFADNRCGVGMASVAYTSAGGKTNTWSTTEAGGECYGCGAVFKEPSSGGTTINGSLESLSLSTNGATVSSDRDVAGALEALEITEFGATVAAGSDTDIAGSLESLQLTENAASIALDRDVAASLEVLEVTANAGAVSSDRAISATVENITLTALGSTILAAVDISVSLEALSLNTFAAAISGGGSVWTVQSDSTDNWNVQADSSDTWTPQSNSIDNWTVQ